VRKQALAVAAWLSATLAMAPQVAWACPSCATREGPGLKLLALVAAMIAVPYAVAVVTIRVVRRLDRQERP
jgi:hypothetical protein